MDLYTELLTYYPIKGDHWVGNHLKEDAPFIRLAAANTGSAIEWEDEPDEKMDRHPNRDAFGSVWAMQNDLSKFWAEYRRLKQEEI
jgi:hypothetical protein